MGLSLVTKASDDVVGNLDEPGLCRSDPETSTCEG